ncbi:Cyclin-C1-1 [Platanthera guangdongensis]|uniref:Cyclin-C1-1 n=1 Tax=Platanthera guangdongensis TaxID=2320717 RepID=A0ABR2MA43_9ASPA
MDFILIHPPYMIALACIYIASVLKDKDTTIWFEEVRINMHVVKNIAIEILDFYDFYRVESLKGMPESSKGISEEKVNAALYKVMPKP